MTFPQSYKEAIKNSTLTHEQIAHQLNLSKRRWLSIFYSHAKSDSKEFRNIKYLVEQLQRKKL
jgi:hypothetical protein